MVDALAQVKREFGSQAVILNTRTVNRGSVLGRGREIVEITAARDVSDLPPALRKDLIPDAAPTAAPSIPKRRAQPNKGNADGPSARSASAYGPAIRRTPPPRANQPVPSQPHEPPSARILSEMGELKSLVRSLVQNNNRSGAKLVPEELLATYQSLIEQQVADRLAHSLIERVRERLEPQALHDPDAVHRELSRALESMLPTSGPIRIAPRGEPTIIALVGPTGVGKTTTIAKLAANFSLRDGRRVGLITIDTYRIAAVEQLRTYASIIDVPLSVASTPKQLKDAVGRMSDREVILIDTAGRGQRDSRKLDEIKSFFSAVKPHEVHLVLSSTCGEAVLTETIERFRTVGIDRVIFTKIDEAIGFGVMLACLEKADAALSYVTTGQDVPDDIAVGRSETLAELVLGRATGC